MTKEKLLTFIWKRQTASGKRRENVVTWSLLLFAVTAILNLPINTFPLARGRGRTTARGLELYVTRHASGYFQSPK